MSAHREWKKQMGIPSGVKEAITYINENIDKFQPSTLPTYKPADLQIGKSPNPKFLEEIIETTQQMEQISTKGSNEDKHLAHPVLKDPVFTWRFSSGDSYLDVHTFGGIPFIKDIDFTKKEIYEKFVIKKPNIQREIYYK